jgi:hypothetical protein
MNHLLKVTLFVVLCVCLLHGCASVNYTKPDGTQIQYTRFLTTNDSLDVTIGDSSAKINGQKIDAETLAKFINMLGAVK